ncbi:MAG: MarC family protein [Rhodospirillaceae bacterium]|nr:MarC family protein [Rhodospirillaceae bacterium]MBT7512363.1 MarC family protein [Rhodospirillaceae bacterium]
MFETALVAFTTFFAVIGPVDVAAIYAALTTTATPIQRRRMAIKGTLIALGILLVFLLLGNDVLAYMGISLAALRTAGGILLLLIGIKLVFAESTGGTTTTDDENKEAELKDDVSVFPLATPLIAGPGAMGAAVLLMSNTHGDIKLGAIVVGAMLAVVLMTFALLLVATQVQKILGVTGLHVISRIFGVLLTALAVQFIFDGLKASGLLG